MELQTKQVELRILTPSEGKWLTQATVADDSERSFSQKVVLGYSDSPENWIEWDEVDKNSFEELMAEREEQMRNAIGDEQMD